MQYIKIQALYQDLFVVGALHPGEKITNETWGKVISYVYLSEIDKTIFILH